MQEDTFADIDFLGLLPCPLKVPFEEGLSRFNAGRETGGGGPFSLLIESNANHQLDFFAKLADCRELDQLPHIMVAPGFSRFFYSSFREKFHGGEDFVAVDEKLTMFQDPDHCYTILCFNPTVMIVDRTAYPQIPAPVRWSDLLKPDYEGKVVIRGHQDKNFCEGLLLNTYKEAGEAGVRALGRAVQAGLHPSQMVKQAGRGIEGSPAVYALPLSFARLAEGKSERIQLVWPEDGAIVNPVVMMTKRNKAADLKELTHLLTGVEMGRFFSQAKFFSCHQEVVPEIPEGAGFKWLGWDFIRNYDLEQLKPSLEEIFYTTYKGGRP